MAASVTPGPLATLCFLNFHPSFLCLFTVSLHCGLARVAPWDLTFFLPLWSNLCPPYCSQSLLSV